MLRQRAAPTTARRCASPRVVSCSIAEDLQVFGAFFKPSRNPNRKHHDLNDSWRSADLPAFTQACRAASSAAGISPDSCPRTLAGSRDAPTAPPQFQAPRVWVDSGRRLRLVAHGYDRLDSTPKR